VCTPSAVLPIVALFQLAAVGLGAVVLARASSRRFLLPFGLGLLCAIGAAIALGSGVGWALQLAHGLPHRARGPAPDLEIGGFGALAGLIVGYVLASMRRGERPALALDALAPSLALMFAVGRAAWFFSTNARPYESILALALFVFAIVFRPQRLGDRFALVLTTYAVGRAVIDLLRGDLERGLFNLTESQLLAFVVIWGVIVWRASSERVVRADRRHEQHDETAGERL
jgi:hypothetical protein